jgi:hypothetical protein
MQERQDLLLNQKKSLMDRIEMLVSRMENLKATQYDREIVSGSIQRVSIENLIMNKQTLEIELKWLDEDLCKLREEIDGCEKILKDYNDRNKLIYYYVKLQKVKPLKLALKYGLTEQHIRRIVNQVERDLKILK